MLTSVFKTMNPLMQMMNPLMMNLLMQMMNPLMMNLLMQTHRGTSPHIPILLSSGEMDLEVRFLDEKTMIFRFKTTLLC